MMKNSLTTLISIIGLVFLNACTKPDPQQIIDRCIEVSGGDAYNSALIQFDFRDTHYKAQIKKGRNKMSREFKSDGKFIQDVMELDYFKRKINKKAVELEDSMIVKYKNSINSVFYFALLPKGLNDAAVQKKYIGETSIHGVDYHKIEVSFKKEGGGEDYQDVYVYWINTTTNVIDYLAYSYEVDGGGLRFRKAYNERIIEGIRFVDYINYKADPLKTSVYNLDQLFEKDELEELSKIKLKNISVRLISS